MAELSADGAEPGAQYISEEDHEFQLFDLNLDEYNEQFECEQAEMDDFQPCNDYVGQIQQVIDDHLNRCSPTAGTAAEERQMLENDFNALSANQVLDDDRFGGSTFDVASLPKESVNYPCNDLTENQEERGSAVQFTGSTDNQLSESTLNNADGEALYYETYSNAGFESEEELSVGPSASAEKDSTNIVDSAEGIVLEGENALYNGNEMQEASKSGYDTATYSDTDCTETQSKTLSEQQEDAHKDDEAYQAKALREATLQEAARVERYRRKYQLENVYTELGNIRNDFALLKENLNSALVVFPDISELFESSITYLYEIAVRRSQLAEARADEAAVRAQRYAVEKEMSYLKCPEDVRTLHAAAQQVQDVIEQLQRLQKRVPELYATSAAARAETYRAYQISAYVVTEQADLQLQQAWNAQNLQENAKYIEKLRAKISLLTVEEEDIRKTCDELEDVVSLISSQNAEHTLYTRQQCLELSGKYRDIAAGLFTSQIDGNISRLQALEAQNSQLQREISAASLQKDQAWRWTMLFGAGAFICGIFCVLAFIA